jgi:hypothetical protein
MRSRAVGLIVLLLALVVAEPSLADKRIALIIGNAAYRNVPKLVNPTKDATAIADLLRTAGFELVESKQDLTNAEMRRTLREFASKSRDADMAVVYYAGHGIEVDGVNYLIPLDAVLEQDSDAFDETVQLDRVLQVIEPAKRLRLVILDACRDNPFNRTMRRSVATRALGRGLVGIEPSKPNTLIAFAAKAGSTADDGVGPNSPFTSALLKHLTTPGLDLRQVFGRVRDDVMKATDDRQEPFVYGSLGGATVSLVPGPTKTMDPAPALQDPEAVIRKNFEFALQLNSRQAWDYFLQQHATGYYANLARIHLDKIVAEETRSGSSVRIAPEDQLGKSVDGTPSNVAQEQPLRGDAERRPVAALDRSKEIATQAGSSTPINDPSQLREIRTRLFELNFDPGPFDGPFGESARRAVREYESLNGMPTTGQPTTALLDRLREARSLGPWAAIVFAKGTDKWGMGWGKSSRQEAIASARSSCGKSDCSIEVSVFGRECAAFAHSSKSWAMVARESVLAANSAALSECEKKGRSCRVIASTCADGSDRAFVR